MSLKQIMAGAGLTHGVFYSYFKNKSDLYVEVLACFLTDPDWKNCWEGVHLDLSSTGAGAQVVQAYLWRQHFEDVENSCPMVALPTDVARSGETARRAFETVFRATVGVPDKIFEVAEGGLTDGHPMIFLFGNPTRSSGKLYRVCFGSESEGKDGVPTPWKHKSIDSRNCSFPNQTLIAEWIQTYGEGSDFVRVRVRGLPPAADELQFIDWG